MSGKISFSDTYLIGLVINMWGLWGVDIRLFLLSILPHVKLDEKYGVIGVPNYLFTLS